MFDYLTRDQTMMQYFPQPPSLHGDDVAGNLLQSSAARRQKLYKTQMCRHILATGSCAHGAYCHFAHSDAELRPVAADGLSSVFGQQLMLPDAVNNGPSAMSQNNNWPQDPIAFAHYAQLRYKTRMCRHMARSGRCPRGDTCCFAHSEAELRKAPDDDGPFFGGGGPSLSPQTQQWASSQWQSSLFPGGIPPHPGSPDKMNRRHPRQSMFKTRLCRYAEVNAPEQCPRGDACTFAHSEAELRIPPRQTPHIVGLGGSSALGGFGGLGQQAPIGSHHNRSHQRMASDCTARWKGAIFAARKSRTHLIALRDTLIRQYRGRRILSPPTAPPPAMSAFIADPPDGDEEGASYLMQSAFETGVFDDILGPEDDLPHPLVPSEARESSQVRYLCLEIECCFAEELRRCADTNAQRRNWVLMARYLASAFDLIIALLRGIEPWHIVLVNSHGDPLPDFHDRAQLSAVLNVLAIVRDQTQSARDDAIGMCEAVIEEHQQRQDDADAHQAIEALADLRQLSFE